MMTNRPSSLAVQLSESAVVPVVSIVADAVSDALEVLAVVVAEDDAVVELVPLVSSPSEGDPESSPQAAAVKARARIKVMRVIGTKHATDAGGESPHRDGSRAELPGIIDRKST